MKYDKQITDLIDKDRDICFQNISTEEKRRKKYNEQIKEFIILQRKEIEEEKIRKEYNG